MIIDDMYYSKCHRWILLTAIITTSTDSKSNTYKCFLKHLTQVHHLSHPNRQTRLLVTLVFTRLCALTLTGIDIDDTDDVLLHQTTSYPLGKQYLTLKVYGDQHCGRTSNTLCAYPTNRVTEDILSTDTCASSFQ